MNAITNPTHAHALTTPILGHNNEIEYIQVIPKESPLSRPEHFKTHFEVTPGKWFESVYSDILTTPYLTYDSRINGNGVAPWRIPFSEIPRHAIKHASSKLYMTPGVFKPLEQCFGKGMGHQDVLFVAVTAIDFDRPQGGIPASPEQVELLARAVPGAAMLKSNGVQMFLRSSGNWEVEAPLLAQIGRYLEKLLAPLFYDASCHLKRDGSPGNHRNHAYRCPWGACDSGPVRCWLPKNDQLATVREVFTMLALTLPPPDTGGRQEKSGIPPVPHVPRVPQVQGSRAGSFQPNHAEFEEIRRILGDLLKSGVPREQAEVQISAMSWKFHSRAHLEKILPTVIPKGAGSSDGRWLAADEWAKVVADLVDLVLSVGPSSLKRMLLQKTRTVRATRAWSFEFLYYFSLTLEEAIAGFFTWQPFEEIRDLSVSAIGRDAVIEDLRGCWERFNQNPERYARNPYSNLPLVSQKTLSLVRQKAHALGNFKMADITGVRLTEK